MTLFQWFAGGLMCLMAALEIYLQITRSARRSVGSLRLAIWISAAVFIFNPDWTSYLASWLNIGRGADAILYLSVIGSLFGFFYVIHSIERQREQLTRLVRQLAIAAPVKLSVRSEAAQDSTNGDVEKGGS